MTIRVSFFNDRCFFDSFTPLNDKNPLTGKAGLNYCHSQFFGSILEWLKLTYCIPCQKEGKPHKCYVYSLDFIKWLENHGQNLGTSLLTILKINSLGAVEYIKKICKKQEKKLRKQKENEVVKIYQINPGTPLTVKQILEKAEKNFENHIYKKEILEKIQSNLNEVSYHKKMLEEKSSVSFKEGYSNYHMLCEGNCLEKEELEEYKKKWSVHFIALNFLELLPGVDISPYTGGCLV